MEDIPLHFNSHTKINSLLRQYKTIVHNYWYPVMATCLDPPLDHLQADVHK
jgi:hypothetical protein